MASESKSDTARQNGSKSLGPVTPEGKARSSQNARKHGLCASFEILPGEDQPAFDALLASAEETYQPDGPMECELVRTLAILRWRLRRIPEIESDIFSNELCLAARQIDKVFSKIDAPGRLAFVFQKLADSGITLPLLLRYETSLNRVYDRTLKQLADLQKLRNEPSSPPPPAPNPGSPEGDENRGSTDVSGPNAASASPLPSDLCAKIAEMTPDAAPFLTLSVTTAGHEAVVRCQGKLVAGVNDTLYARVSQLIPDHKRIVLDLTELTHMDSMGLGTLVRLYISAKSAGTSLELINIGKRIRQLLSMTHLLSILGAISEQSITII
jgi:anti-sigma B factor antagonist